MNNEAQTVDPNQESQASSQTETEASPEPTVVESLDQARETKQLQRELEIARAQIKNLEAKVSDYDIKFIEARSYLKKLESEIQDIRQRSERDAQKTVDSKVGRLAQELLPIVDLFELSLRSASESQTKDFDLFVRGVQMIQWQMNQALMGLGLEKIETKDQDFDPHLHEAVLSEAVLSPDLDGKIIRELKAGYRLSGQVLRPAQVSVGKVP